MCGIVGISGPDVEEVLLAMRDSIAHRGPDAAGIWCDERLGLAHRRLSIVDLSDAARQPLGNEDDSVFVTFNGEIYNAPQLQAELESAGHVFKSQSDTEVLVHGYEEWGADMLPRLNGMFAFAIYDARNGDIFLARDRSGQKPLYYSFFEGRDGRRRFAFASELRAFLACPLFPAKPDLSALASFLCYEFTPVPQSTLAGVSKLDGGHWLRVDLSNLSHSNGCFWEPNYSPGQFKDFADAGRQLREQLEHSIELRLRSDVPLGVFLSGGLDSSTLAVLAKKIRPDTKLMTFSIGFEDPSFDESAYASEVAAALGTEHHFEMFSESQVLGVLDEVLAQLDEPFADPSVLPTYMLSRLARKKVTVALGGDGADELFAGYDPFVAWRIATIARAVLPFGGLRKAARGVAGMLPVSEANMSFEFRVKRLLRGLSYPPPQRHQAWLSAFEPCELPGLLSEACCEALGAEALDAGRVLEPSQRAWDSAGKNASCLNRQINVYARTYLQEGILTKVDRASMAHSLELRAPFLDHDFQRFANSLPDDWKLKGMTTKRLLREAMRELLPPSILGRKKKGFGIPVSRWLRGPLRSWMEATLNPDAIAAAGLFRPEVVSSLMSDHLSRRRDRRKELWALLMVSSWLQRRLPDYRCA